MKFGTPSVIFAVLALAKELGARNIPKESLDFPVQRASYVKCDTSRRSRTYGICD